MPKTKKKTTRKKAFLIDPNVSDFLSDNSNDHLESNISVFFQNRHTNEMTDSVSGSDRKSKSKSKFDPIEKNTQNWATTSQKPLDSPSLKVMKTARKRQDPSLMCTACKSVFSSRTKLFQHLKETGHTDYADNIEIYSQKLWKKKGKK